MEIVELMRVMKTAGTELSGGASVRVKTIQAVNDLSSAILGACTLTAMRLNQGLLAETKKEKVKILVSLDGDEIESHARMNNLCAPISSASAELKKFYSRLNLNRTLGNKDDLISILDKLEIGEVGLQKILTDTYSLKLMLDGKTKKEIDCYIQRRLEALEKLAHSAQDCQFSIGKII